MGWLYGGEEKGGNWNLRLQQNLKLSIYQVICHLLKCQPASI
jgi:hypothetical protein